MSDTTRRGSYAKGIAKREEILTEALRVIAEAGLHGASVKAIAEAVDLSPAGLLHYFDSKEKLFTEVLRKRDERDSQQFTGGRYEELLATLHAPGQAGLDDIDTARQFFIEVTAANAQDPRRIHLYSHLGVESREPQH